MNAKKAKALRRVAREIAQRQGVPESIQHLIHTKTGVVRVGYCAKGVVRQLKKQIAAGTVAFKRHGAA